MKLSDLEKMIRTIPDFPKPGIMFKDITPILQNPKAFHFVIEMMGKHLQTKKVDLIAGIESRGFFFGPTLAHRLGVGFVPIRKEGKLPWETYQMPCQLEYGEAVLELHRDAIPKGSHVVVLDDLLATGGTALCAAELIEKASGIAESLIFLVELSFLEGRKKLTAYDTFSLLQL